MHCTTTGPFSVLGVMIDLFSYGSHDIHSKTGMRGVSLFHKGVQDFFDNRTFKDFLQTFLEDKQIYKFYELLTK